MYEIGDFAMLVSVIFAGIGLYMAHTLYKSPRKRWQCIAAWTGIILLCTAVGEVLNVVLPQFTEQRLSTFTGCAFVVVYLYVFPNIPLPQRIFTYFLADNSMYLLVLLCRTLTMLAVYYLGVDAQITFAIIYLLAAAGFCFFYVKVLRRVILRGLAAFQGHLVSLTVFSVVSYFSLLFIVDAWASWPPISVLGSLPCFGILAINLGGYVLAFRTLGVVSERMSAENDAKLAGVQLALAEKEYHTAMQGFTQTRQLKHDMIHHLQAHRFRA